MRLSTLLILLVSLVASKQLQKKEEDRRELLVVTITVACVAAVVGGVASAATAHALNAAGQAQVPPPAQQVNVQVNNVQVNINLVYDQTSGRWIQGPNTAGSARRLLASSGDATVACPVTALRLPVAQVDGQYRVPDSLANLNPTGQKGCLWWISQAAVKAKLTSLAPMKCLEIIEKAKSSVTSKVDEKNGSGKQKTSTSTSTSNSGNPKLVQATQKVEIFPKFNWQVLGVALFGVALLLASCFASSQQKEVDLYFPLQENVDEF